MKMAMIKECQAQDCSYNSERICHAMAITVGHGEQHPACDTFYKSQTPGGEKDIRAGVGACKMDSCHYNQKLECHASSIKVGYRDQEADCLTYKQR
jgi:hypothetical protein